MGGIIHALNELLHEKGFLSNEDLRALAERINVPLYRLEGLVSFYPHFRRTRPPRVEIAVCRDVACRLAGGKELIARVKSALAREDGVELREVSCLGRCEIAPAASVNEHACAARDVDALVALAKSPPDAHAIQAPLEPKRWASDPYPSAEERYGALRALTTSTFDAEAVCKTLKDSGLRGMGGAAFPTGLKWDIVRKEQATPKYVVCNADESEPGTFKDRVILSDLPHLVIEGMAIAAMTIGASKGIVFIRHEYAPERTAILRAIDDARARGVLGDRFDVEVFVSPGGYILGEETALLECLEDKRGEPRNKPPFPGQKGLFGRPTLINNVETFSLVPMILKEGADAWKARGVRGYHGLKFIALSGDVEKPGVYQVPTGTTIAELVAMAGGTKDGRAVKAIAPGGASSNFLDANAMDAPLDFKALADRGSMLGSGAVMIVAEGADVLDLATNVVAFFRNESCGKCVPCRVGSEKAVVMLEEALAGRGRKKHLEVLPALAETMSETSICGLGQVALNPFLSVLRAFDAEVRARFDRED